MHYDFVNFIYRWEKSALENIFMPGWFLYYFVLKKLFKAIDKSYYTVFIIIESLICVA